MVARRQPVASGRPVYRKQRMLPSRAGNANNGYNCPMSTPLLTTKLYLPPARPNVVLRPRLVERLNQGLHRKLTLTAAPAGFGKISLASAWIADCAASRLIDRHRRSRFGGTSPAI